MAPMAISPWPAAPMSSWRVDQVTTENITFHSDGTFEANRGGQATAVGFWHLIENLLDNAS